MTHQRTTDVHLAVTHLDNGRLCLADENGLIVGDAVEAKP